MKYVEAKCRELYHPNCKKAVDAAIMKISSSLVPLYSQYMRRVHMDRREQLFNYHSCREKGYKFYKYVFWFYFDVAITSSLALYKGAHPTSKAGRSMKKFRLSLADSLIGEFNSRKELCPCPLLLQHYPMKCPRDEGSQRLKRRACRLCRENKIRSDTSWQCRECNVPLCHTGNLETDCFYKWHQSLS